MLEFALSQETARTAPLLPPVEGREENLPFHFVSIPPLVQGLPSLSRWLTRTIRLGCAIQFARRPPKFNGILETSEAVQNAPVLCEEFAVLLAKVAIEPVPPARMRQGFYSPYFLVPKKGGGLRPILDLRVLNRALHKLPFKMLTHGHMINCIQPQDWFAAIDLKDTYFHVSILPRHRPFLRFAFEGRAWQYRVLPFGLSLSPRVFTKVVEGALTPLWEVGVRILNYIYVDHTRSVRSSEQLFVCHGGQQKGKAVSKERLAHWIVEAVVLAYQSQGEPCPLGMRAHSTRSVASFHALAHGASLADICRAAGWATPNTFARFYNHRVEPVYSCVLGK